MRTSNPIDREEIHLGTFSLKIKFEGPLDTQILKEATAGLDNVLACAAELATQIIGGDAYVKARGSVQSVEAGSCNFKDIALIIDKSKELFTTIKSMQPVNLGIICVTAVSLYALYGYFGICHEEAIGNANDSNHIEVGGDVKITLTNALNNQFPDQEETIALVVEKILEMGARAKKRSARGITELVHPNGISTSGISGSLSSEPEKTTEIITAAQAAIIPVQMPKEETKPEEIKAHLSNVCIEVTKVDIESSSDKAIMCRIQEEGYSSKRLPLVIDDEKLRMRVLDRFPKQMYADLFEISIKNANGDTKPQCYILDKLIN